MSAKISAYAESLRARQLLKRNKAFDDEIINLDDDEIDNILEKRKAALKYQLSKKELSGEGEAVDEKGLVYKATNHPNNEILFADKVSHEFKLEVSPELKRIVFNYVGASVFWLIFGTFIGLYLSLKLVYPNWIHNPGLHSED